MSIRLFFCQRLNFLAGRKLFMEVGNTLIAAIFHLEFGINWHEGFILSALIDKRCGPHRSWQHLLLLFSLNLKGTDKSIVQYFSAIIDKSCGH
jgi:hypothetical protein